MNVVCNYSLDNQEKILARVCICCYVINEVEFYTYMTYISFIRKSFNKMFKL